MGLYRTGVARLAVVASLSIAGLSVAQQGVCQQRYATCDETAAEGGLGSGACVVVVTDECGSTQIDFTDTSGVAVIEPLTLAPGQTITSQCRKVADMDTSGLQLNEVRLDDPAIAGAIGGSPGTDNSMASVLALSNIQTMQDALGLFATLGGEVCITLEDAHITTEVTQACVIAELKAGDAPLGEPFDVGCWYEGLACFNATSCGDCTNMADDLRARGRYDGAASCGWCAATSQCLLGGSGGPQCGNDGGCDETSWVSERALCPTVGNSMSSSIADDHAACIAQSMLTSSTTAPGRQSSTGIASGATACTATGGDASSTAAVIVALIGGGLLGFLGGSCCGARVGELMRVIAHRVFPDCIKDPYRSDRSARYSKDTTDSGSGADAGGQGGYPATVLETAISATSTHPPHANHSSP